MNVKESQRWVQDRLLGLGLGQEVFWPGRGAATFAEYCSNVSDLLVLADRVKCVEMIPAEWAKLGEKHEEMAAEAEGKGRIQTAKEEYYRASRCYGAAYWSIPQDNKRKGRLQAKCQESFDKVIQYSRNIERVEIPFEGQSLPGLLHLPEDVKNPPVVLHCPGLDQVKEQYAYPFANRFTNRAMAVLVMDGPGQNESRVRGIKHTVDNYERGGKAAVDYLMTRRDVDGERIGVFGISWGSHLAQRVAAYDQRVKACVGIMGAFYVRSVAEALNVTHPGFKRTYMYNTGFTDEERFDDYASQMSLKGITEKIRCPLLMIHGEYDEITSMEEAYQVFEWARGPKEIVVQEREFHALGNVITEAFAYCADWMRDALEGKIPPDLNKKILVPPRD